MARLLVREADGARCDACGTTFDAITNQAVPWTWRQSQWMHERGAGHTMRLFRYA